MGCRIIEGKKDGAAECAVLFCSTTGWAFGPVMESHDEAEAFIDFLDFDPRKYRDKELEYLYAEFRKSRVEAEAADA